MSPHTKGPWLVARCGPAHLRDYNIHTDDSTLAPLAIVHDFGVDGVSESNARLIAAAPDMLEALREGVIWYDDVHKFEPADRLPQWYKVARALLDSLDSPSKA